MGTTSAKVSDKFQFLVTFASSNPTKKDIKRLERHVNKALRRIKCMGLPDWVVKGLLKDGFTSSKLIKWGKELIDGVINSDNAESCILLHKLIKRKANEIGYMKALPHQWNEYVKFLHANKLRIDLSSAIKIITVIVIIFIFLFLHVLRSNQTRVEKSDIETAQIMLKGADEPYYITRFFPFINIPGYSRPYVSGEGATSANPNIDIQGGALVASSYGIMNSPNSTSTHKDMTAIGQYMTIDGAQYLYLPESIYFVEKLLKCYYNPDKGTIRYVQNPGNDFKPIDELLDDYDQPLSRPWVNLPNTYPLSRTKDDNASNITPYSYIHLKLLTDVTSLLVDAKTIHVVLAPGGFRLSYRKDDHELFVFYSINNTYPSQFTTQIGEEIYKPNNDIVPEGFTYVLDLFYDNRLFSDKIPTAGETDGFYKVYTTTKDFHTRGSITIGSYNYLVVGKDFDSGNKNHKDALTDIYKRLVKYQQNTQYAAQTAS